MENKPSCYLCGATEDLSVKNYNKSGTSYICRPCRRSEQKKHAYVYKKKHSQVSAERAWRDLAREKNGAIAKKYASTNLRIIQ